MRLGRILIVLALLSAGAEAAAPKRVLILHSFGRDFAPYGSIGPAFRTEFARLQAQPVVFQEASLDAERSGTPDDENAFVEFLRNRHGAGRPDLVVVVGSPGLDFYLRQRSRLFPDAALVVTGVEQRHAQHLGIQARDLVVSAKLDFLRVSETILQVLPNTATLAVVVGASPLERYWLRELHRDLAPLASRVRLLWLDGLTLEELRRRVAGLPAGSAVFFGLFAMGADGVPWENEQALAAVSAASSAPVFGVFETQLGKGIVGGPLFDQRQMGVLTAQLTARMLERADAKGGHERMQAQAPVFDWRELERWGIPRSRLPAGAEVRFRPPSLWEQHKLLILLTTAIVLLQAALIGALLFQHAHRRRAEKEAMALSGRLLTAHEDERRRLARELHDDLTQRLARLAIDAARMPGMHKELVRLSEDVHALSYRLHPSVLDDLGLVEALKAECDRVASHGALRVDVDARGVPEALPLDKSLCLFRVAQEALNNAVRHAGASAVTVLLAPSGEGLQLAVSDNGSGFDLAAPRSRASLGLASMRERVRLLQGELDIESTPGRGTTVIAWVPA